MRLGFVSAIVPDLPLSDVFRLAAEIGYSCVEVMCWPPSKAERRYAGVTHIDVTALDQAAIDDIAGLVEETGVEISGLGYYPNPLDPNPDVAATAVQHIQRVMDAAARLGVTQVNTFVGRDWTRSVDANWPRFLETWRPLVRYAEEVGVRIGIENCPMLFTDDEWPGGKNLATSPAIWERMFADIPSPAWGLNYDPSHMVWQQMDYLAPIRRFADRLYHLHAKDVRLDRHKLNDVGILATPLSFHTPKLPGLGEVDWGRFVSELTDVGYDGALCVEVEDRAYEGSLHDRTAALQQSHGFLRNFVVE